MSLPILQRFAVWSGCAWVAFFLVPAPAAGQVESSIPDFRNVTPTPMPVFAGIGGGTGHRAGHPGSPTPSRPAPLATALQQSQDQRANLPLIAAGVALMVAGSFIEDSAGNLVMATGAGVVAFGVYRWLR